MTDTNKKPRNGRILAKDGEESCEICGKPLPEFEYCPGKKHFVCSDPVCRHRIFEIDRKTVEIKAGEKICDRPGCGRPVPPGTYFDLKRKFFCSPECQDKAYKTGSERVTCTYCGKEIPTYPCLKDGNHFCTHKELGLYLRYQNIKAKAGRFADILNEYTDVFCPTHYKPASIKAVRCDLLLFFDYLNQQHIRSLEKVDPRTITRFISWANQRGSTSNRAVRFLVIFFNWMIAEGRRRAPNPILAGIHKQGSRKRLPRPYSREQMAKIWHYLDMRGDTQSKLLVSAAFESGLRLGELSRLHVDDVNLQEQRIFIRTPNKTDTERFAPFADLTKKYLAQWLSERDPKCGHDFLFYNERKGPPSVDQLREKLKAILCKRSRRGVQEDGLEKFSCHAFRHTFASALGNHRVDAGTIMAVGGWKSFDAMQGYVSLQPTTVRRDYEAAMARAAENAEESVGTVSSLEDFARSGSLPAQSNALSKG